jgi:hypothetical protein
MSSRAKTGSILLEVQGLGDRGWGIAVRGQNVVTENGEIVAIQSGVAVSTNATGSMVMVKPCCPASSAG